jgi:hypothetical protein
MISYFCISNTSREFLYVPFNLLAYNSIRCCDLNFHWDPDVLAKLTLLLKEGKLGRERLENLGWEIYDINIPDILIKKFRGFCQKCKSERKILNLASRIFNWAEDSYDIIEEGDFEKESGYSQEDEDYNYYEDDLDNWWLRGEDPPSYSVDEQ